MRTPRRVAQVALPLAPADWPADKPHATWRVRYHWRAGPHRGSGGEQFVHAYTAEDAVQRIRWELEAAGIEPSRMRAELLNPPPFVAPGIRWKRLWKQAKRAALAAGASDPYAFAAWWYQDHGGKLR